MAASPPTTSSPSPSSQQRSAERFYERLPADMVVVCALCGARRRRLGGHLHTKHGITADDYRGLTGMPSTSLNDSLIFVERWADLYGRRPWTKASIIVAIQRWADRRGQPPTANEWRKPATGGRPGSTTVIRAFGSWSSAIEAAGYTPRQRGSQVRR